MLDLGWQELLVIGALALIVVGPKDLPGLLRSLGQYAGKVRGMAREFQRTMDDAARESDLTNLKELKDIGNDIRKATKFDLEAQGRKAAESLMNPNKTPDTVPNPIDEFEKVKKEPDPKPHDPAQGAVSPAKKKTTSKLAASSAKKPAAKPASDALKPDPQMAAQTETGTSKV